MRMPKMMARLLLCYAMLLTGCQSPRHPPQLIALRRDVPPYLLDCQEGPKRPGPEATQRDAALVIIDYEEALEDCKAKLVALRALFDFAPGSK
jgi:hypothetical protein